jgi:adenylate cyclase
VESGRLFFILDYQLQMFTFTPTLWINNVMKKIFLLFTIALLINNGFSQNQHKIDSLQKQLQKFELKKKQLGSKATPLMDSVKINLYFALADEYSSDNPDSALNYEKQCLLLSEKIGFKKGIGNSHQRIGTMYLGNGNYPEALKNFFAALAIRNEIGDKKNIGDSYGWIGMAYYGEGNYPEALKNNLISLKINEEIGYKEGIGYSYYWIGRINIDEGNYQEALKNQLASLKINVEQGTNKNAIAGDYNMIGDNYYKQGKYTEALSNFLEAIKIFKEIQYWGGIQFSYYGVGAVNSEQGNYDEALKNYFMGLEIDEEAGDKYMTAKTYIGIGVANEKLGNMQEALRYETKGHSLAIETGAKDLIKSAYEELAVINAKLSNYKAAYDDEVLFKNYYDTLFNKENEKKMTGLQMQYDFDKIQDSTKAEQGKKDLIASNEIKRQRNVRNYTLAGLGIVLLFSIVVFRQRNKISKEKKRSDDLLLNILPSEVAEELKEKGSADAKMFDDVTVMFTDFKGFTTIAERLSPKELVGEINYCFSAFDNIIHKYGIEKIKTIGDSYMAAGGLPVENKTHAKDVVNAAIEINKFMEEHKQQRMKEGKEIFEIRIGIHTGPVVAGIVGIKKFAYDIWGDTVNLASRMESSGEAGKVNISGSTYELVKNDFTCTHRGKIQAKNKGEVDMYFVS